MDIKALTKSVLCYARYVYADFVRDNDALIAAAVSFYTFLALVPLALLAVSIFAFVLGSPDRAQEVVFSYMRELGVSSGSQVNDVVREVVAGRSLATGVGVIVLLWAGTNAIANLTKAINVAWNVQETRGFVRARLLSMGVLLMLGVLLGISFAITTALSWIKSLDISVFGTKPGEVPFVWGFIGYSLPTLVSITTFTIFYMVMPNRKVPLPVALVGGVFAGVLWEISKIAFSYYVSTIANYSRIYGSLGGVILLLIWIYYSAIVVILGAEVASVWQDRHRLRECGRL